MKAEEALVDAALRTWKLNVDRAGKFFSGLSDQQLLKEVAPGKNRLIYLWGHLTAVNDALLPMFFLGDRVAPELEEIYIKQPDRAVETLSGEAVKQSWETINEKLWTGFEKMTPAEWIGRHANVSEEDFAKEPHRNKYSVLLNRTWHIGYHLGQARLTAEK